MRARNNMTDPDHKNSQNDPSPATESDGFWPAILFAFAALAGAATLVIALIAAFFFALVFAVRCAWSVGG